MCAQWRSADTHTSWHKASLSYDYFAVRAHLMGAVSLTTCLGGLLRIQEDPPSPGLMPGHTFRWAEQPKGSHNGSQQEHDIKAPHVSCEWLSCSVSVEPTGRVSDLGCAAVLRTPMILTCGRWAELCRQRRAAMPRPAVQLCRERCVIEPAANAEPSRSCESRAGDLAPPRIAKQFSCNT